VDKYRKMVLMLQNVQIVIKYLGQTVRSFRTGFKEHLQSYKQQTKIQNCLYISKSVAKSVSF